MDNDYEDYKIYADNLIKSRENVEFYQRLCAEYNNLMMEIERRRPDIVAMIILGNDNESSNNDS